MHIKSHTVTHSHTQAHIVTYSDTQAHIVTYSHIQSYLVTSWLSRKINLAASPLYFFLRGLWARCPHQLHGLQGHLDIHFRRMARMSRSFGRDRNAEGKSGTTKRPSPPATKSRLSDQKQHMTRSHGRSGVKLSACHVLPCHPQAFTKIFTWPRVSRWLIRRILQMSPRRISKAFDTQIAYIVLRLCSQRLRVTMWTYATICNYSACM